MLQTDVWCQRDDASSNVSKRTVGNGVVSYASFDRADRMVSLRYTKSDGTGLAYFDYGRDIAGRILRIERENNLTIYYTYDAIDRLDAEVWRKTSDNTQIYGFWYSYDSANNRLQMRRETSTGSEWDSTYYEYAADSALMHKQTITPPSTSVDTYYGYDENGSLTQVLEGSDATYFGYAGNQLVSRILTSLEAATYFYYDGRLNRYLIDKAGTLTYYLWDGLNQLEERDASGNLVARYTHGNYRQYGIGSVVEVERHVGAATYYQYPLCDHRGTVYAMVDQNQATQLTYTMDAFGRQLAGIGGAQPTVPNDLIYQSNWLTLQIGGRWYGVSKYRLYDMELGVFLQRDFLRYLNKYRAWSNNPVGQVDRDGLEDSDPKKEYKTPLPKEPNEIQKRLKGKLGTFKFYGWDYESIETGSKDLYVYSERFFVKFEKSVECPCDEKDLFWIQKKKNFYFRTEDKLVKDVDNWVLIKESDWQIDNKWENKDTRYGSPQVGNEVGPVHGDAPGWASGKAVENAASTLEAQKKISLRSGSLYETCLVCWDREKNEERYKVGCFYWRVVRYIEKYDGKWYGWSQWSQSDIKPSESGPQLEEESNPSGSRGYKGDELPFSDPDPAQHKGL